MLKFKKMRQLIKADSWDTLRNTRNEYEGGGQTYHEETEFENYTVVHTVIDGIERIHYQPKEANQRTVILFQHGMWHGAWCWKYWQVWFAEQGWESIAFSLPRHGKSLEQKKVEECTLAYYLYFLEQEKKSIEAPVVLCAHSMGGALAQWYLKFFGNLPAIVSIPDCNHGIMLEHNWQASAEIVKQWLESKL